MAARPTDRDKKRVLLLSQIHDQMLEANNIGATQQYDDRVAKALDSLKNKAEARSRSPTGVPETVWEKIIGRRRVRLSLLKGTPSQKLPVVRTQVLPNGQSMITLNANSFETALKGARRSLKAEQQTATDHDPSRSES